MNSYIKKGSFNKKQTKNKLNYLFLKNLNDKNFTKKKQNEEKLQNNTLENIPFNYVEASSNYQGNYQNYITGVIRSLPPIFNIDFSKHIEKRLVLLPEYNKKSTLILDLDETLVHADFEEKYNQKNLKISFDYKDEKISVDVILRPGVEDFLKKVSEMFEIFVFTASIKEYADAVLDYLDPESKIFKHRLYRDSCIPINNKVYIKDLRIFVNRKPENIILVDNSFYSFCNQPGNGVLINTFYNDPDDTELINVLNYLQNYLLSATDVRKVNEKIFNFENLIKLNEIA